MAMDLAVGFAKNVLPSGSYIENVNAQQYKAFLDESGTSEKFFVYDTLNTPDDVTDDIYRLAVSWEDYDKMNVIDKARVMLVVIGTKPYLMTRQAIEYLSNKYGADMVRIVAGAALITGALFLPVTAMALKATMGITGTLLTVVSGYRAYKAGTLKFPELA